MSSSGDASSLSEVQQNALAQYLSVTNQEAPEAILLLTRCQWNVEIAIARFFDGEPAVDPVQEAQAAEAAMRAAQREQLQAAPPALPRPVMGQRYPINPHSPTSSSSSRSRSGDGLIPAPRIVPQPNVERRRPPPILALFFFPFSILWKITQGFASVFSTLFPFLPRLLANFYSPLNRRNASSAGTRKNLTPRDTASRFIREFEEENGVTGLPWFEGGYAQALDLAKKDLKFLLVVLLSPEHDDTTTYNKETLASTEVVTFLKDRDIILWGGSVADSEAYQVSTALQCTKFPFAALIAHTPQTGSTAMSVVTRVVGVVPPAKLISKLTAAIAVHSEKLNEIRSRRAAEAADRNIRDEQNRAYEASLARDAERARRRREEEAERARVEKEEKEKQEAAELLATRIEAWKKWRARSVRPEPEASVPAARLSLVMLDGSRVLRRFAFADSVEDVYAFVECDGVEPGSENAPPEKYTHEYGFRLVTRMPRSVYQAEKGKTVEAAFGKSAALIVEPIEEDEEEEEEDDE